MVSKKSITRVLGENKNWAKTRRTIEEGYELLPCTLGAECEGDGRETVDGVETEQDIVVLPRQSVSEWRAEVVAGKKRQGRANLELVYEHGNRIELIVVWRVRHGGLAARRGRAGAP